MLDSLQIPWLIKGQYNRMNDGRAYVVNLNKAPGSHWIAARKIDDILYYADPLGTLLQGYPPIEMLNGIKRMRVNQITYQHPLNNLCGYYAIIMRDILANITKDIDQDQFNRILFTNLIS